MLEYVMRPEAGTRAVVFDLDKTLLEVTPLGKPFLFLKQRNHPHELPIYTREEIANLNINHSPTKQPSAGLSEYFSLQLIARSRFFPGAADKIKRLTDQGIDLFINTGRPNKSTWADVTNKTLDEEGLRGYFKDIFYRPPNTDVAISKAHVLHLLSQIYNTLEFSDDDTRVAYFIAAIFPEMRVNLVQKNPLRTNLENLQNLKVIPSIITRQGTTF